LPGAWEREDILWSSALPHPTFLPASARAVPVSPAEQRLLHAGHVAEVAAQFADTYARMRGTAAKYLSGESRSAARVKSIRKLDKGIFC